MRYLKPMKNHLLACVCASLALFSSCSPLKSSPKEEKHQMELTLHEIQTNLDDLRHDVHCFQTEMQILDGKIKHHENALSGLKQGYLEKQEGRLDEINKVVSELEKRIANLQSSHQSESKDIKQLTSHANETSSALTQYKDRINELERQLLTQNRKFDEIVKLKGTLESLAKAIESDGSRQQMKIYKVKAGDSLEKIAKAHQTNVDYLKKLNNLEQDLIVVGQEMKVPNP
jgi:LysM repeat protein